LLLIVTLLYLINLPYAFRSELYILCASVVFTLFHWNKWVNLKSTLKLHCLTQWHFIQQDHFESWICWCCCFSGFHCYIRRWYNEETSSQIGRNCVKFWRGWCKSWMNWFGWWTILYSFCQAWDTTNLRRPTLITVVEFKSRFDPLFSSL
jgi:hypothetical protein